MKIYTEEQVITFAIKVLSDYEINGTFYNREKLKETLDVTPIELPSDEEIENNAYTDRRVEDLEYHEQIGFERGAKWMKEKIEWVSNNPKCKQIEECSNSLSKKCICPK